MRNNALRQARAAEKERRRIIERYIHGQGSDSDPLTDVADVVEQSQAIGEVGTSHGFKRTQGRRSIVTIR